MPCQAQTPTYQQVTLQPSHHVTTGHLFQFQTFHCGVALCDNSLQLIHPPP